MSDYRITNIARTVVHQQKIIRFDAAERQADGTYKNLGRFTAPIQTRYLALHEYITKDADHERAS